MPAAIHGQNRSCGSHHHFYEYKLEIPCPKRFRFSSNGSLKYHGWLAAHDRDHIWRFRNVQADRYEYPNERVPLADFRLSGDVSHSRLESIEYGRTVG